MTDASTVAFQTPVVREITFAEYWERRRVAASVGAAVSRQSSEDPSR